ncbi:MAG: carbamoyltransferase [Vicinamibacteria bacterium]|nr:carbamoyltransferase [Vicinamibacteria bacterium]
MYILGISAFYHDSAACLVRNGEIVAAAQEERFTRRKHDAAFPISAIKWCLEYAGIDFDAVDYVGFYEKPYLKLERILGVAGRFHPHGFEAFDHAVSAWAASKAWMPGIITSHLMELSPSGGALARWDGRLVFSEHHQAHAASAFYPSPFADAAILVMDGVGEWATTSLSVGSRDVVGVPRITFLEEIRYPDSLGMLYSAFTSYLGFRVNSGEYKVMGLAPYGKPRYADLITKNLIEVKADGSYRLNIDHLSFPYDYRMVNDSFLDLFGRPAREPEQALEDFHLDVAASIQAVTEQLVLGIGRRLHALTGQPRLCLAGGVALNCVANGLLLREGPFSDVWVQPAATDAGGALGVALFVWHDVAKGRRHSPHPALRRPGSGDLMKGALLGPRFSEEEITSELDRIQIPYERPASEDLCATVAALLAQGMVIGWFQGRMEFGPRALGARSILADSRSPAMQRTLNLKIKYRESFRPFAPAVLRESASSWFDLNGRPDSVLGQPLAGYDSPYMLLTAPVREERRLPPEADEALTGLKRVNGVRSSIPSCTHVDFSARVQTVNEHDNPRFHELLTSFGSITGVPVLVNTSFNVRGEPIVCTPEDAIRCFLGTEMDILVLETVLVRKSNVSPEKKKDYRAAFALD